MTLARRLLLVGESPARSAPLLTLARALELRGFSCSFSEGSEHRDTAHWRSQLRASDCVVYVGYAGYESFAVRQLALAALSGVPVIRWWVGSDVHHVLQDRTVARWSRILQKFLAKQIAVSPHLVEELASIRVQAMYIPSVLDAPDVLPVTLDHVPKYLLVYMPQGRREFYGEPLVRRVIEANPDIGFVIVADDGHALTGYPNVRSLGWSADLGPIWNQVGGLLRITQHDGMPRMVLDALRRAKHVIYSWPLPGCTLATTYVEAQAAVDRFRDVESPHLAGIAAFSEMFTPDPAERWANTIDSVVSSFYLGRRLMAAKAVMVETTRLKLRGCSRRLRPHAAPRG